MVINHVSVRPGSPSSKAGRGSRRTAETDLLTEVPQRSASRELDGLGAGAVVHTLSNEYNM